MKSHRARSPARKTRPKTIDVTSGNLDLAALAARINDNHGEVVKSAGAALEFAVEAGNGLNEAKRAVPHGEWLAWLDTKCEFSSRTATTYMRIARSYPTLRANQKGLADFDSIGKAIAALAKPMLRKPDDTEAAGNTEKADKHGDQNGDGRSHGGAESAEEADAQAGDGAGSTDADQTQQAAEDGQATDTSTRNDQQQEDHEPEDEHSPDEQQDPFEHLLDGHDLTDDERELLSAINREVEELLTDVVKQARRRAKRILRTSPETCDVEPDDIVVLIGARLKQSLDPFKQFGPERTDDIEL